MLFSSKVVEMVDLTGQVPNISKSYRLEIDGVPKPQARPRLGRYGFYNPRSKELAEFKSRVKEEVGCTIFSREQPVSVCIKFYMRRPNAHFKANKRCNALKAMIPFAVNRRPDIDNLIKFVLDGMNEVVHSDDAWRRLGQSGLLRTGSGGLVLNLVA